MVTPNLYGNIVANVVAGLTGGPGIMPGANVGNQVAVFEQGARHVGQDVSLSSQVHSGSTAACSQGVSNPQMCCHTVSLSLTAEHPYRCVGEFWPGGGGDLLCKKRRLFV